ncbi:hypothetical protein F5890DRAFT_102720 [Lentinula detonsa]|uniref:R3H domain-containing protein n=1 Tax=Lentinula detonsa TaxID=2804962 RepID=A0AA38PZI7_9AGAR|nr:hypothetical protein F5890DRAFT_102720 [Lentinula detonsa]
MEPASSSNNAQQSSSESSNNTGKNHSRRKLVEPNSRDNLNKPDDHDDQSTGPSKPQKYRSQSHKKGPRPLLDSDKKIPTSAPLLNSQGNKLEKEGRGKSTGLTSEPSSRRRNGSKEKSYSKGEGKSLAMPAHPAKLRPGKAKFNAGLTADAPTQSPGTTPPQRRKKKIPNKADAGDLTSNLIRELSTYPYLDCLICFSSIHPQQPTWSCSPLIPMLEDDTAQKPQYCWTTFHLTCIREWAEKNYKEVKAAWEAREEFSKDGEWRCPGCQGRRNKLIKGYLCFCGSTRSPRSHLATPHSCGNACSRPRISCSHPCPLLCHPGPCPPCKVIMDVPCECIRQQIVSVRCGEHTHVSCGQTCSKMLGCGKHHCQQVCHPGHCPPCERRDVIDCWCGKERKEVKCGEGDVWFESLGCDDRSTERMQQPRKGFGCHSVCGKAFDCGDHTCTKSCHPPASDALPGHCPISPDRITTCPCGKQSIATFSSSQNGEFPPRTHCTDPIPTCTSICLKPHSDCEHLCQEKCHTSAVCPPCSIDVVRPCRCGNTTTTLKCGDLRTLDEESGLVKEQEILCKHLCTALRACGKHQCRRICCPLASVVKGKMKAFASQLDADPNGLHECDLVCGKMLSCGNHPCQERDHKGPCQPCLRSSFEELICFCGRTVLEPPIPCGTKIYCGHPCSLPSPPCGHPKTPHTCHFPDSSCPPCVHLTGKPCACGKKILPNIRCSLDSEKVSCGLVCGKLLPCGGHKCDRKCHGGECGACTSMCGKARKLCLPDIHPCTNLCHAPTSCDEDEPCQTRIELTCECGRIRQAAVCGRCRSNPAGLAKGQTLKCTTDCALKKRNARLADALGITPGGSGRLAEVTYNDELVAFAKANSKFLRLVEDALAEFVQSNRTKQSLPAMPPDKRGFVSKLAGLYRLDSQMVDQEPHRSVQIIRRVDTRIPTPLLSTLIVNKSTSNTNLGKLVTLRGGFVPPASTNVRTNNSVESSSSSANAFTGVKRGWTSVVAPTPTVGSRSTTPNTVNSNRTGSPAPSRPFGAAELPHSIRPQNDSPPENIPDSWEDDI